MFNLNPLNTDVTLPINGVSSHRLFKDIVLDAMSTRITIGLASKAKIEAFVSYITSVNPYMFFTVSNITNLTDYINTEVDIRDLILNATDIAILEYLGEDGNLDILINNVKNLVYVNKNISNGDKKLYDSRIVQSLMIEEKKLVELLENNTYLLVCYYVALYSDILLVNIESFIPGDIPVKK